MPSLELNQCEDTPPPRDTSILGHFLISSAIYNHVTTLIGTPFYTGPKSVLIERCHYKNQTTLSFQLAGTPNTYHQFERSQQVED